MPPKTKSCFSTVRHCSSDRNATFHLALVLPFLACLAQVPSIARAESDQAEQPGVADYCDYAWGSATSSVAQQLYPRLFVSGGILTGSGSVDATGTTGLENVLWRLQAGMSYGLADLTEALAIRNRARADCVLYRRQSDLYAFLVRYDEPDSLAGAQAKIAVLEQALPTAEEVLRRTQELLSRQQATVDELNATTLRVDTMRAELGSSRARVASFSRKHQTSVHVAELMQEYRSAIRTIAQVDSRVRLARRYDLSVRAGYDRIFGVRDGIPLFATLTLTLSPGGLTQPRAEERAQRGRLGWASYGVEGIHDRVAILLSRLQAVLEAQSRRRLEARVLLADLEARYKAVEGMQGDSVRAYRDYLWFDLVRLRAEDAYLRAQIDELHSLLSSVDAATARP